jgi:hypothetical protein
MSHMSHDTTRLLALTSMSPLSGPAYGMRAIADRIGAGENADRLALLLATHPKNVLHALAAAEWSTYRSSTGPSRAAFIASLRPQRPLDLTRFCKSLEIQ